ncbi:MAG: cation-translocating P-type ATPase, partial [Alistipes sp.]|nr:cation-translocating P-type ATPase [Alistipes sp.]
LVRYDDGMPHRHFAETVAANTTAHLDAEGAVIGNPTEGALLAWLRERGEEYGALRDGAEIVDRMTFSTERKYMATLVRSGLSGRRLLCVKGAPEIVRAMCVPDGRDEEVAATLLGYQRRAMRTLALAWAETEADACDAAIASTPLRFSAVAAIADPVRDDVPAAVGRCLDAGIAVKIVTGDTPATACEIARRIGLWSDADGDERRMTGTEFAALADEELLDRVEGLKILARARPLDKQRLVRLLQRRGEVVAVTGDGTNDAPALNFANVGLSMGSGTSVAKEASAITLLDDSFASIATAVMWGRSLYRNIQRFVLFQLTVNLAAILVCLIGTLAGTEMPLTVVQILWVNIIMDTFAAMAMASLPPRPEVMGERPRRRDAFILSPGMRRTILTCGLTMAAVLLAMLFGWSHDQTGLTRHRLTIFFTTFVFMQFWNMFNAKGFEARRSLFASPRGCREFFLILAAIGLGQWAIVTFGGEVFRTEPLAWEEWAAIVGATSLLALGGEAVRAVRRRTAAAAAALLRLASLPAGAATPASPA